MDQNFYLNLQTIEDIRILLSPLQQQHGQLKYLSCQTTNENSRSIDEVSKIIMYYLKDQLGMYNIKIFIADNNFNTKHNFLPKFITCYKYLLLNTNFSSQYLLKKDMRFGHVVGLWPTLSPCLFVQILWYSRCEDLLIESIVHIPLDLCVEILQITIEHINELTLLRARRLILLLIYKIYYKFWRNIVDDENTMISLHRAIIIECHYLNEFIKQNNFLMKNEQLFLCLKQLIGSMKSEESILTLQELCYDIAKGKLHGIKELIKRYKEWDLYTLDFIRQRHDLHRIILQYMKRHFDDNCLEYLYNEKSFDTFLRQNLVVEEFNNSRSMVYILL
ncbi:PREDICTED: uncharacterized protein LOC108746372 [Trachymyrmex septentrionalis]|uniref:uncharacterized protein LOC108746372 n=1 Tax=Trachymyrmex septentrionalis TaxID=34720 RepID=UPI00084EDBDF|nr:PREDICTED: uncharacterized protein LOC108746372 [Trachymyrmex septentrionalis]